MADGFGDKLAFFQATEILSAHRLFHFECLLLLLWSSAPGLAWRIATLPFYVVSGAVALGFWIAGGVPYRTIGLLAAPRGAEGGRLIPLSVSTAEAADFERDYPANPRPRFAVEGFMHALLHSPEHPDVLAFCRRTLRSSPLVACLSEHFVVWGGRREEEGFEVSNSLKASRFPFCAIVVASNDRRISLLHQIEGLKTPEEMLTLLQRGECAPSLIAARLEAEEW